MENFIPSESYKFILENMAIVCVDVAIYNHKHELLLIKRRNEPARGQFWLPGGRIYKGEVRRNAAIRKVHQECGIVVDFLVELFTSETIFEDGPDGIPVHSVNTVYFTMIKDTDIKLDSQASEFAWLSPADWLLGDIHPYVAQAVRESSRLLQ